ncbi:NADPH-dependent FMN reductase [Streptomyces sp. SBT349]|uniref:NADPH-dependent FMN reductase n=1 Tax=Streptomyces sp. SBT349 TaxID=1580539 RepID=UPI00066EC555|nr:NADPH-dependent FMN reductase [Streptomyces sp. SBT349]
MPRILVVSAGPSPYSGTEAVGEHVAARLTEAEWQVEHLRVRALPPAALLGADGSDPVVGRAMEEVSGADGIVLATPVYKASFSGLLKVFLDLLPECGFVGKVVLPLATGGSAAHVLAVDYALRPVVQSLGARHTVQSYFLLERHLGRSNGSLRMSPESTDLLDSVLEQFREALIMAAGRGTPGAGPRP